MSESMIGYYVHNEKHKRLCKEMLNGAKPFGPPMSYTFIPPFTFLIPVSKTYEFENMMHSARLDFMRERPIIKKFFVLGANNLDCDIEIEPCSTKDEAVTLMKEKYETTLASCNSIEHEFSEKGASIYCRSNDLYYWKIAEFDL